MATFSGGSDVVYYGNPTEKDSNGRYRDIIRRQYWSFNVTGDYVYYNNKRYLRITKVTISTTWYTVNGKGYTEANDSGGYYLIYPYDNAPGTFTIYVRSRVNNSAGNHASVTLSKYAGTGLRITQWNPWPYNYSRSTSATWTGSQDIELPNGGGIINVWLRTNNCGIYDDWGHIGSSQKYGAWDPNNPGVQYCTKVDSEGKATWETHKIKRYNGSSWVNIPGKRYDNDWKEVRG